MAALLRGGELVLEVHAGRPRLDHRLHELKRMERPSESSFRIRDDRDEPVDLVIACEMLFFVLPPERVVDLPDDVRNAVGRIQAQIRIHLARAVAVRGDLPAAQVDRLKAGAHLLDRLVPGEGPEGADTAFRLQETPQTSGSPFGEGVPDADRSPEPDDVVRPVRPDDARPPFIHFPVRFQTPGLIDHAVDRLLLCE